MRSSSESYHVVPLTEGHCRQICSWEYPSPYHIYNWRPWELMVTAQEEFADPLLREAQYRAVVNDEGTLCGFAQFFPLAGVTRLGLGLRPDLCGEGRGTAFIRAITEEACVLAPTNEIDLEVVTWNERAIASYRRAGFEISDTYRRMTPAGEEEVHCMVWAAEVPEFPDQG